MSQQDNVTVTLESLIRMGVNAELQNIYTMMPGVVQSYDPATQTCSVQPSAKAKNNDDTLQVLPVINRVPVAHLRAGKAIIHVPLKAGDSVELRFSMRSIDNWKSQGGVYDPDDPRMHALSDCVAYPGIYSIKEALKIPNPNVLTLLNDQAYIEIQPNGTFKVYNAKEGVELISLLVRLIQAIIDARVETLMGPQPDLNDFDVGNSFPELRDLMEFLVGV